MQIRSHTCYAGGARWNTTTFIPHTYVYVYTRHYTKKDARIARIYLEHRLFVERLRQTKQRSILQHSQAILAH
jgi:hypothetical protein